MPDLIERESLADRAKIDQVLRAAFPGAEEARLVEELREGQHARVALLARRNEDLVGYILFSGVSIAAGGAQIAALALAPLAVLPACQKQGIGSALVRMGLAICQQQGHERVVVLGHPRYYARFGFSAELAAALESPFGGGEAWMALELVPGALRHVKGRVTYPQPFLRLIPRDPAA
jgi:putative acetyltransferase